MTKPRFKSKSWRQLQVKAPGGRLAIHYERKKPKFARCSNCGRVLYGIPRVRSIEIKRVAKTERRPERPYGGNLCSSCMRELFRARVRAQPL